MKKISLMLIALMATVMMSATVVTYDFTNPSSLGLTPSSKTGDGVALKDSTITVGVVAMSFSVPSGNGAKLWTASGPSYTLRLYQPSSMVLTSSGDNIRGIRVARSQGAITELDENSEWRGDAKSVTLSVPDKGQANYITAVTVYVGEEMPKLTVDTISVSEARARIDKGEKQACYIKGVVATTPFIASSKNCVWLTDINNPGDSIEGFGIRKGKASSETYKTLDEMAEDFGLLDTVLIKADGIAKYNSIYETTSGYYVETLGKAKTVYANGIYKFAFGAISLRKVEGTYVYDVVFSKVESETPDNAIHYVIKSKSEKGIKGSYKLVATGADSSYVDGEGGVSGSVTFTFMGADGVNNKYGVKAVFQKDGVPYVMDTTFSFCGWTSDYQESFVLEDDRSRGITLEAIPAGAITVAQALEMANALADNDTSDVVIVTGYLVKVKDAFDTQYKNESFYLDDEYNPGSKDNLQIYRCKLAAPAIAGDQMWVEGRLYKFVDKYTTLEMIKGTGHFAQLSTSLEEVVAKLPNQEKAQKIFVDGNIYIVRGGVVYSLQGNVIK